WLSSCAHSAKTGTGCSATYLSRRSSFRGTGCKIMSAFETLLVKIDEGIGTITLNRPETRNAMNPRLHAEMNRALDELIDDETVRVIILTGAGESFSSGNDLKEFFAEQMESPLKFRRASLQFAEWREKLRSCPKPTIAAVDGWCLGGGLSVLCVCDF